MKTLSVYDIINISALTNKDRVKLAASLLIESGLNTNSEYLDNLGEELRGYAELEMSHKD